MKDKNKTYIYKIIDDRYLEMGGKPYEYGEEERLSFAAHEIDLFLFEMAIPIVRSQVEKKEWPSVARRLKCKIFENETVVRWCGINEEGKISGDDGGGWEAANDHLEWNDVKSAFDPKYISVVERVQFETMAKDKEKEKDWDGLLKESERFLPALNQHSVFWFWIGMAHRELNQNDKAGTAFRKSLQIDFNNIGTIRFFASSCFLLGASNVFYDWLNEYVLKLNTETQTALIEYLETSWKGHIDHKLIDASVLKIILKRRKNAEDTLEEELKTLKLAKKKNLLAVLNGCISADRYDLIAGVLGKGLAITEKDDQGLLDLLLLLLNASRIRFEEIPENLQTRVLNSARKKVGN